MSWAFALTLASAACLAQAQQGYTIQELKNPGSGRPCRLMSSGDTSTLLNAAGDVVGLCDDVVGLAFSVYPLGIGPGIRGRPTLWRNGKGQWLPETGGARVRPVNTGYFLTDAGDIHGGIGAYPINWLALKASEDKQVFWKAGKMALFVPPAPLKGKWVVDAVSHGGALLLRNDPVDVPGAPTPPSLGWATVVGGQVTQLSQPSVPSWYDGFIGGYYGINDKGQVALGAAFWSGTRWHAITGPGGAPVRWVDGLNNQGEVTGGLMLNDDQTAGLGDARTVGPRFIWSETGATVLPGELAFSAYRNEAAMNDKGQVVGAIVRPNLSLGHAALWQPGQAAIDLNQLVKIPNDSGSELNSALSINARGQILVRAGNEVGGRHFLLTPK